MLYYAHMTWAGRRRLITASIVLVIVLIIAAFPVYRILYVPPSCTDGKQNQGEAGIDCGGPCVNVCTSQAISPILLWTRVFKVSQGYYNAIAFVQNANINAEALKVPYRFQIFDTSNILVAQRYGTIDLLPNTSIPIFESNFDTGQRIPGRVDFEFTDQPHWQRTDIASAVAQQLPEVDVSNIVLSKQDSSPRLDAVVTNTSVHSILNLPVVAILYDVNGNAVASSRTYVDVLAKESSTPIVFTWPQPFSLDTATLSQGGSGIDQSSTTGTVSISQKDVYPLVGLAQVQ
jgi:hypothetical protein